MIFQAGAPPVHREHQNVRELSSVRGQRHFTFNALKKKEEEQQSLVMSDRCFKIRRESGHIPSGRQLPRTPPSMDVRRHLDFTNDDPADENLQVCFARYFTVTISSTINLTYDQQAEFKDRDDLNRMSDFNAAETKTGNNSSQPLSV